MNNEIKNITNNYLLDVFNYEEILENSMLWSILEKKAIKETNYITLLNDGKAEVLACYFVLHNEGIKSTSSSNESISIGHVSITGSNELKP